MRKVKKEAINQEKIFIVHISWASLVAQAVKNPLVTQQTWVRSLGWDNEGDVGSIPESGRSPGEGNGNPLQYSFLENSMDRGLWFI